MFFSSSQISACNPELNLLFRDWHLSPLIPCQVSIVGLLFSQYPDHGVPQTQQDPGETPGPVMLWNIMTGTQGTNKGRDKKRSCGTAKIALLQASGHQIGNFVLLDCLGMMLHKHLQMFTGNLANVTILHLHVSTFPYKKWQSCWKAKKCWRKEGNEEKRVETHETVLAHWASLWKRRLRRWPEGLTPVSLTLWLWKFGHILEEEAGTVL